MPKKQQNIVAKLQKKRNHVPQSDPRMWVRDPDLPRTKTRKSLYTCLSAPKHICRLLQAGDHLIISITLADDEFDTVIFYIAIRPKKQTRKCLARDAMMVDALKLAASCASASSLPAQLPAVWRKAHLGEKKPNMQPSHNLHFCSACRWTLGLTWSNQLQCSFYQTCKPSDF